MIPTERIPHPTMPTCETPRVLVGQKALVTGANSGIGREVAITLAEAGADVAVNYVADPSAADDVVAEIEQRGSRGLAVKADVSVESQVKEMFSQVIETFGTLDILVPNAGIQKDAAIDEMTVDQWNAVLNVNLTGQFLCAREAVREFKRRGVVPEISCSAGKIVSMSSVHDSIPWAGHANYAASKGGVMLLYKSLAQELAPYRIRVNAIAPGAVRTPINTEAWETQEAYDTLMNLVPYNRIGEPRDIGQAAVWLASDQSDYVVGTTIYVDGGMMLYPGFATGG
ncbi:MAG TPA: SDR family oxidoreductase [Alkalispirochaeta sp.]|nr:SDR family oxidoreductase [Alkalispirochaeta sp.]